MTDRRSDKYNDWDRDRDRKESSGGRHAPSSSHRRSRSRSREREWDREKPSHRDRDRDRHTKELPSFQPSGNLSQSSSRQGEEQWSRKRPIKKEEEASERRTEKKTTATKMDPMFGDILERAKKLQSNANLGDISRFPGAVSTSTKPESKGKKNGEEEEVEFEKPSFVPSGKLAEDTNLFKGVLIKYNEPPEAKKPNTRWRLYPFKGEEQLSVIYIHRQSAYLIGRDRKIADFPVDHPSCSKQHAVIQYRSIPYDRPDGTRGRQTKPYIIDLGSGNGTYLNDQRLEPQRYVEMRERDVLKFGFSSREYILLKEKGGRGASAGSDDDDDDEDEEDEDAGEAGVEVDMSGAEERRIKEEEGSEF